MSSIEEKKVLEALAKAERDEIGEAWVPATELEEITGFSTADLNDAFKLLHNGDLVEITPPESNSPYVFYSARITLKGRRSLERE